MEKIIKATIVLGLVTMEANGETLVRKHRNLLDLATNGMDHHSIQQRNIEVDANGNVESSDQSVDATSQLSPSLVRKSMEIDAIGNVEILDQSPSLVRKSMKDHASLVDDGRVETSGDGTAVVELESSAEFQKYGPYPLQRNILDYFKQWSNGNIAHQLKRSNTSGGGAQAWLQEDTHEHFRSGSGFLGLLRSTSTRTCIKSSRTFDGDAKLYKSTGDPHDVFHGLLVLPDGALQYAAVFRGTVMAAEPSLCQIAKKDDDLDDGDGDEEQDSGESHLLDIESDPTVKDCGDLFARTVQQQCGTNFEFEVISASEHVIDGIEIEMTLKVTEGTSEYFHTVSCDFEIPWGDQTSQADQTQTLPEEKEGFVATLLFQGSVCEANQRSTSSETDSLKLMQNYRFGENSFYKGNEWMRTVLPLARISLESSTPSSFDMRVSYRVCFPGSGYTGPVRNQGNCGSCWAFAAATAAMTTLCTKHNGQKDTVTGGTRYEISTQQIMSCNSYKYGCKGGNAYGAHLAWQSKGLFKERDFRYMCGHGSALNHFDSGTSCKAWPWGKNCPSSGAFPHWKYSGMYRTSGEAAMKQKIAEGVGMYVNFKVYRNFFGYRSGVYSSISGSYAGGHAVVPVGYGTASGTKYWALQNSWGSSWGSNGYFNMKRGINLAQIESYAAYAVVSSTAPTPTSKPTSQPTNVPTQATRPWTVSGPCNIQGSCVTSPNYPASYNNRQRCTISKSFGAIQVVDFNTEGYFDKLRVGSTSYSGRRRHTLPNGVVPTADITWSSDYSVTRKGWKICSAGPAAPTPPPASYSCGRLVANRDCTERSGRLRLSASSTSSCQTKCAQQSRAGCCEWEHDWRICYFQPSDRNTHYDYGSRWCRPCRSASMCRSSRSLLDESEETMSSSDADKLKMFEAQFELLDSNTDGKVDEIEAVGISSQSFAELDANGDSFLNSTEFLESAWY